MAPEAVHGECLAGLTSFAQWPAPWDPTSGTEGESTASELAVHAERGLRMLLTTTARSSRGAGATVTKGIALLMTPRILNYMLNRNAALDLTFQALADSTRRSILTRLARGPATVSQLARPLDMSLPAVMQHLAVLEGSGLVRSAKAGRVRTCRIEPRALTSAERWINHRRLEWEQRLDRLGTYLETLKAEHAAGGDH